MDGEVRKPPRIERVVAELARGQHGVVSRSQLMGAGLSPDAIDNRLNAGRLHRLHRGVYLVGHTCAPAHAYEMAAVLACGSGAVLSHRSAAHLWELFLYPAHARLPQVTVQGRNLNPRAGIRLHRVTALDRREVTFYRRIPVVTPARALLDLAAIVKTRELERALAEAHAKRRVTDSALEAVLSRNGRRAGTGALRDMLRANATPALTRSEAEERLLALTRGAGLPEPNVNTRIGPFEVDFLWLEERLVIEVDGFQFHSSRSAFERDRRRDAELQARGFRVMRVTWRQLVDEPEAVVARITRALAAVSR